VTTPSATTSTTTSRATTTPATTASVTIPAAAKERTKTGAEAFARHYYESVGRSYVSGDTSKIEAMARPTCTGCGAFVRAISERKARGEHTDKSSIVVKLVSARSGSKDRYVVNVAGNELPVRVLDAENNVVETSKPGVFTAATEVVWDAGRWHIEDFRVL
jgi:hypothetical protein